MSEIDHTIARRQGACRQFDYRAALAAVDDEIFRMLGSSPCSMIEWCFADIAAAHGARLAGELSHHACSLSVMAGYLGATPIERSLHEIESILKEADFDLIASRLEALRQEVERFLPLLRERLRTA